MSEQFDVSQFEIAETGILTVQNIRGDDDLIGADGKNPVKIELYSPGSKEGVRALHRAGQQAQVRMQNLIRGKLSKTAAEEADREQVDKLVGFTKSIINFPIEASALYSNPKLGYIKRQVEKFLDEDANFLPPVSPSSPSTSGNQPG